MIFYHNKEQREVAEASKRELNESGKFSKPIAVAIEPAGPFYSAEEYHQDFYKKNPSGTMPISTVQVGPILS